ncbi:hypothetical protein [Parvularcula maris]|uniref:Uncharacterized protein n=1 Tax=Parvularcula maris TaxID=2965077 RepID=A0A9X2RHZ4_9PROT|nr:hypothetical protein [Parvularcula maris]MCQ8185429.1 hypothetical protein [Parvularcula maris]
MLLLLLAISSLTDHVVSDAPDPSACSYEITMESNSNGETELMTIRYDQETDELEAFDADGEKIESERDGDDSEKPMMGFPTYADVAEKLDLPWRATDNPAIYIAADLPKGSADMGGVDLSKNALLTLRLADEASPTFVESYRAELTKPQRVKMVAKLKRFEQETEFAVVQGWPRPVRWQMAGEVSALGKAQDFSMLATYQYGACADAR